MCKYPFLLLFFVFPYFQTTAQMTRHNRIVQENFNWGFHTGFDAKNAIQQDIYQNGKETNSSKITNQVGFQCALFGRVNLGYFFIQPEGGYYYTREKYQLNLSRGMDEAQQEIITNVIIDEKSQSINTATLLGYNIVKSDAYIFNLFLGPNFRYIYTDKYKIDYDFENKNPHYTLSLITGISANVSYLYFDFRYEIKIPTKNYLYFSDIESSPSYLKDVFIKKSENILCFSLGMMF